MLGYTAVAGFPTGDFLAHWWVFPAAVLFATIALASGVSGALFFSPFFILLPRGRQNPPLQRGDTAAVITCANV